MSKCLDSLSYQILNCAYRVHSNLGNGLLERVYRTCLAHELRKSGLNVREEVPVPLVYDGIQFDQGFRLDLVVEEQFVLELKVTDGIAPNHVAQVLSYLRFTQMKHGFILNFMEKSLKNGIKRIILDPNYRRD